MRSRPPLAVLAMGLAITSCTQPDSAAVETLASTMPTTSSVVEPAPQSSSQPAGALVVTVDGDRATVASGPGESTDSSSPDQSASTGSTGTPSTAPTGPTTSGPTTSQTTPPSTTPSTASTTRPPTTTTSAPSTTQRPTTATETRPEILRLDLPTFGGGTFDTNSVAGENVILWFWGAH